MKELKIEMFEIYEISLKQSKILEKIEVYFF